MLELKIKYDNGDYEYTKINATLKDAKAYYIGKKFNIGISADKIVTCIGIEIIK